MTVLFRFKLFFPSSELTVTKDVLIDANSNHPYLKLNPGDEIEWDSENMGGDAVVGDGRIFHEPLHPDVQIQEMNLTVTGNVNFDLERHDDNDELKLGWWDDNPNA